MLIGLMLIGMVMETIGIGLVIPALALLTHDDLTAKYPLLIPLLENLGNPGREQLAIMGMLFLVGAYAVKSIFLGFLNWKQISYVYGVQVKLSMRLFIGYLRQSYIFHLQHNSAQLIRNVMTETSLFAHTGLKPGMLFLTELFVLVGISTLLLIVEPFGAILVISVFGLTGWVFYFLTHKRILSWGEARQYHDGQRIQHLQQGLGGTKEVNLLGREEDFIKQYELHNIGSARVGRRQSILMAMPRLGLEFLAVSGLAMLVVMMIVQGKPLEDILPTVGLFSAAAFRLMPSVNRLITSIQNIRYSLPVIDILYGALNSMDGLPSSKDEQFLPFNKKIILDDIHFKYPSTEGEALSGITLSIPHGSSVGFIGGSGAGKSTLIDIILGLLTPETGAVRIDNIDIQENLRGWQNQIGYVSQTIFLTDDTLRRNVAFALPDEQIDEEAVWQAIHAAQLEQFVKNLPEGLDTLVGERGVRISGGQRQRIGIARALYHDPTVLVLDEATSSLDPATEREIMQAVTSLRGHKTILIVAHRISTVEQCDYIYRIEKGRIVEEGAPAVLFS